MKKVKVIIENAKRILSESKVLHFLFVWNLKSDHDTPSQKKNRD